MMAGEIRGPKIGNIIKIFAMLNVLSFIGSYFQCSVFVMQESHESYPLIFQISKDTKVRIQQVAGMETIFQIYLHSNISDCAWFCLCSREQSSSSTVYTARRSLSVVRCHYVLCLLSSLLETAEECYHSQAISS